MLQVSLALLYYCFLLLLFLSPFFFFPSSNKVKKINSGDHFLVDLKGKKK